MSEKRNQRRTMYGTVVSAKAKNTVTVVVDRTYKHPRYGKYLRRQTKYLAHDPEGAIREGDLIEMMACRPISKRKRWRVVRVLKHVELAEEARSPDRELAEAAASDQGGEA